MHLPAAFVESDLTAPDHPGANGVAVADRLDALGDDRNPAVAALMRERRD